DAAPLGGGGPLPRAAWTGGAAGGDWGAGHRMVERPGESGAGAPGAAAGAAAARRAWWRRPSRRSRPRSRFYELVRPHPVLAFLFRRRTLFLLLGGAAMLAMARPRPVPFAAGVALACLGI